MSHSMDSCSEETVLVVMSKDKRRTVYVLVVPDELIA